jgi:hypothetical protein
MKEFASASDMWQKAGDESKRFLVALMVGPGAAASIGISDGEAEEPVAASLRSLRGVAAQLQGLGYEAGIWDLMGSVQIARRALQALNSIIASLAE